MRGLTWKKKNFVGEIFLLLGNIAIILGGCSQCYSQSNEFIIPDTDVIESDLDPTTMEIPSLFYLVQTDYEEFTYFLNESHSETFGKLIPTCKCQILVMYIMSCANKDISWSFSAGNTRGEKKELATYKGNKSFSYKVLAEEGLYQAELQVSNEFQDGETVPVNIIFALVSDEEKMMVYDTPLGLQEYGVLPLRNVKFRKNLTANSLEIRWPRSDMENHYLYEFAVIISNKTFYQSICEYTLEKIELEGMIQYTKYTHFEFPSARRNEIYFVSVFLVNQLSFPMLYARGNVTFEKTRPVSLKDGKVVTGHIKNNNGRLSYRYKVSTFETSKELLWYVIPCGGVINVEIRQKKHVIIAKHKISHYRVYNLSNVSGGERYVMKIWDESQNEIPEFSRVEVFATMHPNLHHIARPAKSWTVRYYGNVESCTPVIGWMPVMSFTGGPVRYRIYIWKKERNSRKSKSMNKGYGRRTDHNSRIENASKKVANQCNLDFVHRKNNCAALKKKSFPNTECGYKEVHWDPSNQNRLNAVTEQLPRLSQKSVYLIRVIAYEVNKGKHRTKVLPYDELVLSGLQACSTSSHEINDKSR